MFESYLRSQPLSLESRAFRAIPASRPCRNYPQPEGRKLPFGLFLGYSGGRTGEPRHLARPLRPRWPLDCAAREWTVDRRAATRATTNAAMPRLTVSVPSRKCYNHNRYRVSDRDRVNSFASLRRALKAMGAVLQMPTLRQVDWYFSAPKGRLKLRHENRDAGELIFYVRPSMRGRGRFSLYRRLPIHDVPGTRSLLAEALGEVACVRKSREVWLFRNARIHLDRVAKLGSFVEVEVVVRRGTRQTRVLMNELIRTIGLSPGAFVGGSYVDLFIDRGLDAWTPGGEPSTDVTHAQTATSRRGRAGHRRCPG